MKDRTRIAGKIHYVGVNDREKSIRRIMVTLMVSYIRTLLMMKKGFNRYGRYFLL